MMPGVPVTPGCPTCSRPESLVDGPRWCHRGVIRETLRNAPNTQAELSQPSEGNAMEGISLASGNPSGLLWRRTVFAGLGNTLLPLPWKRDESPTPHETPAVDQQPMWFQSQLR